MEFALLPCPDGPLGPPCGTFHAMALAAVAAGLSLGLLFPGLLPVAAAAASAVWFALRERPASTRYLGLATGAVVCAWLLAAAGGLVLAHG